MHFSILIHLSAKTYSQSKYVKATILEKIPSQQASFIPLAYTYSQVRLRLSLGIEFAPNSAAFGEDPSALSFLVRAP